MKFVFFLYLYVLTDARIVIHHGENSIAALLRSVVRANTAEHRGESQLRPGLVTCLAAQNKIKFGFNYFNKTLSYLSAHFVLFYIVQLSYAGMKRDGEKQIWKY